jgi:hypothetical protein
MARIGEISKSLEKAPGNRKSPLPDGGKWKAETKRAKKEGLMLRDDSAAFDGFSTLDIVNGLHGVCAALDADVASNSNYDTQSA